MTAGRWRFGVTPPSIPKALRVWGIVALLSLWFTSALPHSALAKAFFEDGYLGLTQAELRAQLGQPHAVRDRKAALRVFNYYTFEDWEKYFKKLISPQNGEDVYRYTRDGVQVQYSFGFVPDLRDTADFPTLYVNLVDIEFSPPVAISRIPSLVQEFQPTSDPKAPAFRSNLWVLMFKGPASPEAHVIVRERGKDRLDWTLSFQMFSLQGLPEFLTVEAPIDRMEISAQSLQMVKQRQRLTHEPIMNPYSKEFALRPPPPPPPTKKIPRPKYAD